MYLVVVSKHAGTEHHLDYSKDRVKELKLYTVIGRKRHGITEYFAPSTIVTSLISAALQPNWVVVTLYHGCWCGCR